MEAPAAKRLRVDDAPAKKCDDSTELHFTLERLEDFNQPFPSYRQPVEIGYFSVDGDRKLLRNRSQLKYYSAPKKLHLPLSLGYESCVAKKDATKEGIQLLLEWITYNAQCFQPQSPSAIKELDKHHQEKITNRPDNILTDFVTWRGMLTKIMITPFNRNESWAFLATKYNGTIYLRQVETEEDRQRCLNETQRDKLMSYWGHKFEDYMTTPTAPTAIRDASNGSGDPVNPNIQFVTVARTRINTHSIVMGAEIDCCDHGSKEQPPRNYIELKTSRFILTDRNKYSFKKYKLLKWWAQSYLIGVPKIVCGFRDDDGYVKSLEHFKTIDIPREVDMQQGLWDPAICLNFFDKFLTWLKTCVALQDNPRVAYLVEYANPSNQITAKKSSNNDFEVLPDWYINKDPPP